MHQYQLTFFFLSLDMLLMVFVFLVAGERLGGDLWEGGMEALNSTRLLKEEFVSNLTGSSKLEIFALSAAIPAFLILRLISIVASDRKKQSFWSGLLVDFLFVVLPALLLLTIFADHSYIATVAALLVAAILLPYGQLIQSPSSRKPNVSSKLPFLVHYRFVMMLVTCICILAVDFNTFPRRYAKTETYGTSLMDLGVGSFVVANAMVSRQARGSSRSGSVFSSVSPLLVLGFLRLLATRGVDYQVHVGEYGVHWNFFFTLAAVSLITSSFQIPVGYSAGVGFAILTVYQCSLLCGLNSYLASPHRGPGLLSLNKEGIFSIFGYCSLHLFALQLGHFFFQSSSKGSKPSTRKLWLLDGILWLLVLLLDRYIENVSRRSCNMAYVVLVLAQNLEVIGLFSLAETFFDAPRMPLVDSFDQNLLLTFLVANLLTGLVNLSMNTIFVPALAASTVLVCYMVALVGIAAAFKVLNIRVKFW